MHWTVCIIFSWTTRNRWIKIQLYIFGDVVHSSNLQLSWGLKTFNSIFGINLLRDQYKDRLAAAHHSSRLSASLFNHTPLYSICWGVPFVIRWPRFDYLCPPQPLWYNFPSLQLTYFFFLVAPISNLIWPSVLDHSLDMTIRTQLHTHGIFSRVLVIEHVTPIHLQIICNRLQNKITRETKLKFYKVTVATPVLPTES